MAGKKNGRTSKTDHVLSLLTGTSPESAAAAPRPEVRSAPETAPETAPAAPKTTSTVRHNLPPILDVARANQEALSETIREALEESLEAETAAAAPAAQEPAPEAEPAAEEAEEKEEVPALTLEPEPEPAAETSAAPAAQEPAAEAEPGAEETEEKEEIPALTLEPEPEPEAAAEAPSAPAAQEPAPREAEAPAPGEEPQPAPAEPAEKESSAPEAVPEEEDFVALNIMEPLVEQRMEKYIGLFGLCSCSRCRADVRALALSRLPPKYMVLSKAALTPMVSFFSAKYDTSATAQVIYACKQVMEHPRHRR